MDGGAWRATVHGGCKGLDTAEQLTHTPNCVLYIDILFIILCYNIRYYVNIIFIFNLNILYLDIFIFKIFKTACTF